MNEPQKPSTHQGKTTSKEKNSNPYDNLYLIWYILREHASRDYPLTANKVFEIMSSTWESYPSAKTVSILLNQRLDILTDIFSSRTLPSASTVQKVLRQQGESTDMIQDAVKISCLAKNRNKFEDYFDYCEKQAKKQGVEELTPQSKPTRYYYLESPLNDGEWKILTDLIRFAPWISKEQSAHFLKVIHQLGGMPYCDDEVLYSFKRENKNQFDIIHTLHRGIQEKKQVSITYGTHVLRMVDNKLTPTMEQREKNGSMVILPLSLLWSKGNYYVIARYKENGTMHLRVDRILKATLTREIFTLDQHFSVVEHRDRSPMMYGGSHILVRFSCPCTLLNTVLDMFGNTPIYQVDGENMNVTVKASKTGVKFFALQHLEDVEILEPLELREELVKTLEKNIEKYKKMESSP